MLTELTFYLFSTILLLSGAGVILARNPVHSVLLLILAFFNAAGLMLLLGAEFIALTLVIVYVGAVAVLFLFVIMMLDVDFAELRAGFTKVLPLAMLVGSVLLAQLIYTVRIWPQLAPAMAASPMGNPETLSNTKALGQILYTDYVYQFQTAGLILLVAMIGAIVLTLRHRPDSRRQNVAAQVARARGDVISIQHVPIGGGIDVPD